MRILDLHIDGFGKFHDCSVTFTDGLNILYGKNEAGKSTLHTFIRCMLFGLERGRGRASRNDLYTRCEPWQNTSGYGGQIRLEHDGMIYRIHRNFQKDQKSLTIVNETEGKEVEPTRAFLDHLLGGLTETTYSNTVSIGQLKSATDAGMVSELRNYIANMNTTGSMALNITRATAYLKAKRKEFERLIVPEAARTYTALLGEIKAIEKEISAPEYENQLNAYQEMRAEVRTLLGEKQEQKETLLQKIARGKQALSSAQFSDESSILRYQKEAEATYAEYCTAQKNLEKQTSSMLPVLLFILTAICGIGAAALFLPFLGLSGTIRLAAGGVITFLGICFGVSGAALVLKKKNLQKELNMVSKILQEIFSRHLGDPSISQEAMEAFLSRMDEFLRLYHALERSEHAVQEHTAEIASLQEQETTCEDQISRQQRTQWELEKKLDHLTRCKDQVESLKHTISENEKIREEISAIDLALETMTELSSTIRDSFGLYLNKAASDLVSGITGGIYSSMSVDENLNVFMNTKTRLVPVSQVSSGTMDQVYLALRLAAARLIQPDGERFPLIFDDSFVLYDDERLRSALRWLYDSFPEQIILFTCHQREAQMLTASQIPYHLVSICDGQIVTET